MKTLVSPKHAHGPAINSYDQCYARNSEGGLCPGVRIALWLNSLGEDDEKFNGMVRDNWLRGSGHIVAREPLVAALAAEERCLRKKLAETRHRLAEARLKIRHAA